MFAKKIYAPLQESLSNNNIEAPLHNQKQVFSTIKSGADMVHISPTENGKTTILAISIIQKLQKALNDVPRAIVFVANEETASDTFEIFSTLAKETNLRIFNVHGTGSQEEMKTDIYMGSDIIIGMANRIGALYTENVINLSDLRVLAIDDFEQQTKQDTNSQIERLADSAMKAQFIICATKASERIERFADRFMRNPHVI